MVKRVDLSRRFEKGLRKAPRDIRIAFRNRLEIYSTNKYSPILNNHALEGKYKGYRSINVTGDWRAIFREIDGGEVALFDLLGTHSQLYK